MHAGDGQHGSEVTLSRTLGLLDITMIGVGAMIGAGIFVLTGIAAGEAGPALILAFFLNGVVTTFTALSYAELGSCFPEAGGGYLWVKEGLGGTQGFLAGWMSWFAHAVACSLYGLGFGRFAVELIMLAYPGAEAYTQLLTFGFMILIVALFAYINVRGASETGLVGNVVTIAKIVILAIFVGFGIQAMMTRPSLNVFTDSFLPNGIGGVFVAMGLTFIAFEGYEIIAQSGEEVKDPKRNIPLAVFISIGVVVVVYVLVALVAIGAVVTPPGAGDIPVWEYLAQAKEVAIVRAAEQFMGRWGGILVLISGLASTMSALNATVYSSSRVSFAMGRGRNLPQIFSRIHPTLHTPHWAVIISAVLIIVMALALPIDEVAKAADVMFLFMFAQVNVTLITLRGRRPDLDRGFMVPFFPWPAWIGIITNMALAGFLAVETGRVGIVTALWIGGGGLLYWFYFRHREAEAIPAGEIVVHTQAPVTANYTVMVPVASMEQAADLGRVGSKLAQARNGELLALHVILVPPPLTLSDGRVFVEERLPILETVSAQAEEQGAPVHTMLRLGRSAPDAITRTASENASDLMLLSWRTFDAADWRFSLVIDRLMANPPTNTAILRSRPYDKLEHILVPVAGGPNSRLAAQLAVALALTTEEETRVTLLYVAVNDDDDERVQTRAETIFRRMSNGLVYPFQTQIARADSAVEGILAATDSCEMIAMGASVEPLVRKWLFNDIALQVAEKAPCSVLIARRQGARRL